MLEIDSGGRGSLSSAFTEQLSAPQAIFCNRRHWLRGKILFRIHSKDDLPLSNFVRLTSFGLESLNRTLQCLVKDYFSRN